MRLFKKWVAWSLVIGMILSTMAMPALGAEQFAAHESHQTEFIPTAEPRDTPSTEPTDTPTAEPTDTPMAEPTDTPTTEPTDTPTTESTSAPTSPSESPEPEEQDSVNTLLEPEPELFAAPQAFSITGIHQYLTYANGELTEIDPSMDDFKAYKPLNAHPVGEDGKTFLTEYGDGINQGVDDFTRSPYVYITGYLPKELNIKRVYTGEGLEFSEIGGSVLLREEDGSFAFILTTDTYSFSDRSFAGCYYFELSDGAVYTLIVDVGTKTDSYCTDPVTGKLVSTFPSFVSLYNTTASEWLDDSYQITKLPSLGNNEHTSTVVEATLEVDTPSLLQVQVQSQAFHQNSTVSYFNEINWPAARENWVVLNGKKLPDFVCASDGAGSAVFSAPFALQPGLNVLEVCSNIRGARATATPGAFHETVWFHTNKDTQTDLTSISSVVYLIDYQGTTAGELALGDDTSLRAVNAVSHGDDTTPMQEYPLYWDEAQDKYILNLPETLKSPGKTYPNDSYGQAILLTAIPTDPAAVAEVVSQTNNGGNLIIGKPVGAVTALGLAYINEGYTFEIKVTAGNKAERIYPVQLTFASSDASLTGASLSGASLDTTFSSSTGDYYVNFSNQDATAELTLSAAQGAKITVDGAAYEAPVQLSASKDFYCVAVTAPDGITTDKYYFVPRHKDPVAQESWIIPFKIQNPGTQDSAKHMLRAWYTQLEGMKEFGSYWAVFFAKATGNKDGTEYDFNNKAVYDVSKHHMKQATDWAACILQIIMLGENPYSFPRVLDNGTVDPDFNYVAALEAQGGGPFANNTWYALAANAAGVENIFFENSKKNALSTSYDLDTRGWTIAALSSQLDTKEMVRYVDSLHDSHNTSGDYISLFLNKSWDNVNDHNLFTVGCVLTGIASSGGDPERLFAYQGHTPLQTIEDKLMTSDGLFILGGVEPQLVKDMIIGLGDTIQGSNVWARYALTEEKYHDLIAKAQENSVSIPSDMPKYGAEGYGKAYYDLYDAVAEATGDTSIRPTVIWGMPYQLFEDAVAALPSNIKEADLPAVKGAITQYEALDDANKQAVSKDTLTAYRAAVAAALDVQDATEAASGLYKRILALRDPLLISEDDRPEVEAIRKGYNALGKTQQALLDWAGPSVLQRLGKAEAALGGTGEEPEIKPQKMTITFELLGAPNDGESGTVNTLKTGNLETWHTGTYNFNAESLSAEEAFRVIMGDAGIAWRGDSANSFGTLYVSGIQNPKTGEWLEEFTTTANSGWMYTVNGTHPNVGMSNYTLHDGNRLVVHFTDDYTVEQGSEAWNPPVTKPKDPTAPSVSVDASMGKDGVASGIMSGDAVTDFVKALESATDAKGTMASIELTVPKDSKGVQLTVPRAVLKALANTQFTSFEVRSDAGSVTLDPTALAAVVKAAGSGEVVLRIAPAQVKPDAVAKDLVGDRPIFEVTLKAGGKAVTDLGGAATLVLPYAPAKGEDTARLTVLYLPEVGKAQEMEGAKYDKTQKGLVFSTPHLSTFAIALQNETPLPFTDVKQSDWFYDAVVYAYRSKLFNGTTGTAFSPNGTMTRAMLVTVLWRLEGEPEATAPAAFADMAPGAWYAGAVAWAGEKGIVTGDGSGFSPEGEVTREQIASILYRYAKIKGYDVSGTADLSAFADGAAVSAWAARAMQWANAAGLITGKSAAALDSAGTATRAEVAAILQRLTALAGEK